MKLKLVNAKRYTHRGIPDRVAQKGDIVTVTEDVGEHLLTATFVDKLNNVHPVWVEVPEVDEDMNPEDDEDGDASGDGSDDDDDTGSDAPRTAKAVTRPATRATKVKAKATK